jgi:hypothetical protein
MSLSCSSLIVLPSVESLSSRAAADYVFTMIRASKFYGLSAKVLDDID